MLPFDTHCRMDSWSTWGKSPILLSPFTITNKVNTGKSLPQLEQVGPHKTFPGTLPGSGLSDSKAGAFSAPFGSSTLTPNRKYWLVSFLISPLASSFWLSLIIPFQA